MMTLVDGESKTSSWQQGRLDQSWAAVQEDEDGTLKLGDITRDQYRRRRRVPSAAATVRRGMVRNSSSTL